MAAQTAAQTAVPTTAPTPAQIADAATGAVTHVPGSAARLDTGHDLSALRITPKAPPPPPAASRGRLEAVDGAPVADLGLMVQGEVQQHTFVLENRGDEPIVVHGISNSCGCTVSRVTRVGEGEDRPPYNYGEAIAVGERLELLVTVDSEGKRNLLETMVTVQTNGAEPTILRVTARVEPFLLVSPEGFVVVPPMRSDETQTSEFSVRSASGQPFALTVGEPEPPKHVRIELSPVSPDADGRAAEWKGLLVAGPDAPEGVQQHLHITLVSDVPTVSKRGAMDHSRVQRAHFYAVLTEVVGLVRAQPTAVSFSIVRPGLTVSRTVRVEVSDDAFQFEGDPAVRLAESAVGTIDLAEYLHFQVEVAPDRRSAVVTMTLSDLPESVEGLIQGTVEIAVGHPSKPVILVPFTAVCRPQIQGPAPLGAR
jgi:hypothetical protein